MPGLCFVKLGGSLITDKLNPHTPRLDVIHRLVAEITEAIKQDPGMQLILGHGSGSFGHVPAHAYGTRQGVHSPNEWNGFIQVWKEARALNQIVMDALDREGIKAISFPPSACITAVDGKVKEWSVLPMKYALNNGLVPVVYGDVIFDTLRGGTIFSTEEIFMYLATILKPDRILIAGLEEGVWKDFPQRTELIREITPANYHSLSEKLGSSAGIDVTGGMLSKVKSMLALAENRSVNQVLIFSAGKQNTLLHALLGENPGTVLHV